MLLHTISFSDLNLISFILFLIGSRMTSFPNFIFLSNVNHNKYRIETIHSPDFFMALSRTNLIIRHAISQCGYNCVMSWWSDEVTLLLETIISGVSKVSLLQDPGSTLNDLECLHGYIIYMLSWFMFNIQRENQGSVFIKW